MKIMAEKFFLTVEWAVENFCCWHRKIHGKKIASPKFEAAFDLLALTLELYPRGFTGRGENVAVRVRYKSNSDLSGDFFLVAGSSSLLWAHELKAKEGEGVLELSSSGPKFEDLAGKMEEDRLTLKCRVEWDYDEVHRARTEIDAFDSVWKISPGTFLNFESDDGDLKTLATIRYPLDDDEESGEMSLLAFPLKDSRFELALEPEHRRGRFSNVAVSTRLVVRQGRSVVRRERRDHLFVDRKRWTPLSLMTSDEVTGEGFGAVLCIRVVPSNRCKHKHICVFAPKYVREASRDHSFRSCFDEEVRGHQADGADDSVLSRDMRCLYQDRDFTDFLIKCDGVSFPVHRAILSARSPVFKTMLSSDMTEASSGCMDIKDIDPSTLSLFLTYLYTGTVEDSLNCDSAPKLYYAAGKYQVHSLKRECADFLSADLSVSNVCDVLSLADRHRDEGVRSAAHDFVLENYNAILTSPEWEGFQEGEPLLAVRTLTSVSVRRGGS